MAAKYLVTSYPGTPVPGVGFVKAGDIFTAPADYVPSKTHVPLNEEGRLALVAIGVKKAIAALPPASAPKVERTGRTLAELGALDNPVPVAGWGR
jgi:hypothetical protein